MKMKPYCFLSVLLILCAKAVGQMRQYVYIPNAMTRRDAQKFCRNMYTDLATVTNTEENIKMILPAVVTNTYGWFGLQRSAPSSKTWKYSDGAPVNYYSWYTDQPSNGQNENCANAGPLGWNDQDCSVSLPFFCYKRLVLVNKNKTWNEALAYCRKNFTGMANLISQTQLDAAKTDTLQNQEYRVWMGLHFLDGKWFWLNNEALESNVNLPQCPARPFTCGARDFGKDAWENRDCNEKLYFLCY